MFDAAGKLVREWYGAQLYGNWCQPDLADPTSVWLSSNFSGVLQARADYASKTWRVHATYDMAEFNDWFGMGFPGLGVPEFKPLHHNGQTYLASAREWPIIFRVDEPNRRLVPLVYSNPNIGNSWQHMQGLPESTRRLFAKAVGDQREMSLIWTRPDGGVDELRREDLRLSKWWGWTFGWTVDENFNYVFENKHSTEVRNLYRLSPTAWTADGALVYDFGKRVPLASDVGRSPQNHPHDPNHPCEPAGVMCDGRGNLFAAYDTDMKTKPFGQGFWSNRAGYNKIAKWDKDGRLLWLSAAMPPPRTLRRRSEVHLADHRHALRLRRGQRHGRRQAARLGRRRPVGRPAPR